MMRSSGLNGKKLKLWFENNPLWVILSIISFVFTLAIAAGTIFSFTASFIDSSFLWKAAEQRKIDNLAPTQTLAYFNSVLGEPNTKSVSNNISRYIYKKRGYWVETFVDKEDVVQVMDITACGNEGFHPVIKNNPAGNKITLGKTKMIEGVGEKPIDWRKDNYGLKLHYFLRGASKPSYYFDEYYGGGPSNYQTVFVGHNELCGFLKLPGDISKALDSARIGTIPLSAEQVNRLRTNTAINTFGVTSPSFDLKNEELKNIGEGGIGVSYVDEGVLLPARKYNEHFSQLLEKINDFETANWQ